MDLELAPFFWKLLVEEPVSLEDIKSFDRHGWKQSQVFWCPDSEVDSDVLCQHVFCATSANGIKLSNLFSPHCGHSEEYPFAEKGNILSWQCFMSFFCAADGGPLTERGLIFTCRVVELVEGGQQIAVTMENRAEYFQLWLHFRLHEFDNQVLPLFSPVSWLRGIPNRIVFLQKQAHMYLPLFPLSLCCMIGRRFLASRRPEWS